jgi:Fur family peroxide stress response transcriptional regulator
VELSYEKISQKLKDAGMKVTPQRHAILEAVYSLANHPTAEHIIEYIRKTYPGIATGTVYKVLEILVEKGLIRRVKTDRDAMRYDAVLQNHHHMYCADTDRIEDFFDEELDRMLQAYFKKKDLPGFEIDDIILQINGNFKDKSN